MAGGGLFVPFTVVLPVDASSAGELKNIDQFNANKLVMKRFRVVYLGTSKGECATQEIQKTSEIFHTMPRESVA